MVKVKGRPKRRKGLRRIEGRKLARGLREELDLRGRELKGGMLERERRVAGPAGRFVAVSSQGRCSGGEQEEVRYCQAGGGKRAKEARLKSCTRAGAEQAAD